ncbi:MAG: hypothetical protein U0821_12855 [Chloroflexota bacterium]
MTGRLRIAILLLVLVTAGWWYARPVRVAATSILLLPEIFENAPSRPLRWITEPPRREEIALRYSAGSVIGDLYVPATAGPHGAVILLLGARPAPRDDPTLTRFAEALGRAGAVVMVSESSNLSNGLVLPQEVDAVAEQIALLQARADVDRTRVAILGFSVGGSVGLLSAADPRTRGQLSSVTAFGSYYDATDILRAISQSSLSYAGIDAPWQPNGTTIWVVARQIVDTLPAGADREIIERIYMTGDETARDREPELSQTGRTIVALLDGTDAPRTEALVGTLPETTRTRLRQISPSSQISAVHTPVLLMHDVDDTLIPYPESRRIASGLPAGRLELFTEFDLFAHVTPDGTARPSSFAWQLARLWRQVFWVLMSFL